MRTKRLLKWAGIIFTLTVGPFVLLESPHLLFRTHFRARYDWVRRGMTSEEVRAVMEGPWGGPCPIVVNLNGGSATERYGDHELAYFDYTADGKVVAKRCGGSWEPDWLEAMRWRCGL
jgi:hypothetical protein